MSLQDLTDRLKAEAVRLGFDQVGIAPAVAPPGYPDFLRWLAAGHAAGMDYLRRQEPSRAHPAALLGEVRSIIMVSLVYGSNASGSGAAASSPARGKVARYARGVDYHRVLWDKLEQLLGWLHAQRPEATGRAVVDTAPLLERDYAQLAGLGWIGKNTMLIHRRLGSFTFLGALLTNLEFAYDRPHQVNHCGSCTRCLDACPTDAFAGPYELDARRCISYWTIEHRGMLSEEAAENLHGWVFGCDICQDVCPWNRKAPSGRLGAFAARPDWIDPDLIEWLELDPAAWRAKLAGTALARAKRVGLLRNAAHVLGHRRVPTAVPALAGRLDDLGEHPQVRAAAAWALGRIATQAARDALDRHQDDPEPQVAAAVGTARHHGRRIQGEQGRADGLEPPARSLPPEVDSGPPPPIGEDPGGIPPQSVGQPPSAAPGPAEGGWPTPSPFRGSI
ncbi:MAG TPA: tRNA epoxyqueuosine(34) reductase QueG [Isosphaeraceae bacterium]|nr:tRNA epoxyqueuosine(34) reductase QueG [Isosphaeraceae bacterium]